MTEFAQIQQLFANKLPDHRQQDRHPDKNRYRDIKCFDQTRVKLLWPPGTTEDYIHANWIRGNEFFV